MNTRNPEPVRSTPATNFILFTKDEDGVEQERLRNTDAGYLINRGIAWVRQKMCSSYRLQPVYN